MKIISQAALYATVALSSLNAASSSGEDLSLVRSSLRATPSRLPASFSVFSPELLAAASASSALGLTPLLEKYEPRYPGYKGIAAASLSSSVPGNSGSGDVLVGLSVERSLLGSLNEAVLPDLTQSKHYGLRARKPIDYAAFSGVKR